MIRDVTSGERPRSSSAGRRSVFFCVLVLACALTGCTPLVVGGAVVGTAAKVAVGAAKVPVKATGAAIDAVTDDDEDSGRADEDAD